MTGTSISGHCMCLHCLSALGEAGPLWQVPPVRGDSPALSLPHAPSNCASRPTTWTRSVLPSSTRTWTWSGTWKVLSGLPAQGATRRDQMWYKYVKQLPNSTFCVHGLWSGLEHPRATAAHFYGVRNVQSPCKRSPYVRRTHTGVLGGCKGKRCS